MSMMDYRARRRFHRAQRAQGTGYRRQMRGYYGGFGGLIWVMVIASLAMTHLWQLSLLAFFGLPFFFLVLRPIFFSPANAMNQTQSSQPKQEQGSYQQPYPSSQQESLDYEPYTQGYGEQQPPPQQRETSQEGGQQYQYPAQQTPQYEEPVAMYPQE